MVNQMAMDFFLYPEKEVVVNILIIINTIIRNSGICVFFTKLCLLKKKRLTIMKKIFCTLSQFFFWFYSFADFSSYSLSGSGNGRIIFLAFFPCFDCNSFFVSFNHFTHSCYRYLDGWTLIVPAICFFSLPHFSAPHHHHHRLSRFSIYYCHDQRLSKYHERRKKITGSRILKIYNANKNQINDGQNCMIE